LIQELLAHVFVGLEADLMGKYGLKTAQKRLKNGF
jgi:hypothetical protein